MPTKAKPSFFEFFSDVTDLRVQGRCLHSIEEIFFLAVCGVLAGCDGPSDIALFAEHHIKWFRKIIPLKHGIPSHDTISRVFNLINPQEFSRALLQWIESFLPGTAAERTAKEHLIALDGKTVRGSARPARDVPALHLLNAWSVSYQATIAIRAVGEKTNEIPEIPEILKTLALKNAIITIDAIGCQKDIAKTISEAEGNYILALKDNHPTLFVDVVEVFDEINSSEVDTDDPRIHCTSDGDKDHHPKHTYWHIALPENLSHYAEEWDDLKSIGCVISQTTRQGKEVAQVRYYISSLNPNPEKFATSVRSHWQVENTLHWTLDMSLSEDMTSTYLKNAVANLAAVRRFVHSLLKQDHSPGSLKSKRKIAGWDLNYMKKLLFE